MLCINVTRPKKRQYCSLVTQTFVHKAHHTLFTGEYVPVPTIVMADGEENLSAGYEAAPSYDGFIEAQHKSTIVAKDRKEELKPVLAALNDVKINGVVQKGLRSQMHDIMEQQRVNCIDLGGGWYLRRYTGRTRLANLYSTHVGEVLRNFASQSGAERDITIARTGILKTMVNRRKRNVAKKRRAAKEAARQNPTAVPDDVQQDGGKIEEEKKDQQHRGGTQRARRERTPVHRHNKRKRAEDEADVVTAISASAASAPRVKGGEEVGVHGRHAPERTEERNRRQATRLHSTYSRSAKRPRRHKREGN